MTDWFDGAGGGQAVDVPAVMDSGVPAIVAEIVQHGALVSIGTTSDGGALSFTVTLNGRWRREYFRDSDEATNWLLEARDAVIAAPPAPDPSPVQRRRQRGSRGS